MEEISALRYIYIVARDKKNLLTIGPTSVPRQSDLRSEQALSRVTAAHLFTLCTYGKDDDLT